MVVPLSNDPAREDGGVGSSWNLDLGTTLRLLGQQCGTDDPLAGGDPDRAPIRVRAYYGGDLPVGEVAEVRRADDRRFEVVTWFLNPVGAFGAMAPNVQRELLHDPVAGTLRDALDRVTHRLVALWYESFRGAEPDYADSVASPMSVTAEDVMSPSSGGLRAALARELSLRVRVDDCIGRWAVVPMPSGRNGVRFDPAYGCRIVVGPVPAEALREFAPPCGPMLLRLLTSARRFAGRGLRMEVEVRSCEGARIAACANVTGHRFDAGFVLAGAEGGQTSGPASMRVDWDVCDRLLNTMERNNHAERV